MKDESTVPPNHDIWDDYRTTRQAAKLLGLSLGTVQHMVETGLLRAWKTSGGHRRIDVRSIEDMLRKRNAGDLSKKFAGEELRLLVAEDDIDLQLLYAETVASWGMPVSLQVVGNGFDGLMQIGLHPPHVLIADLLMPGVDGFEMIRRLRSNPKLDEMDIIVVTGYSREEVEQRGGLPPTITLYEKPIPFSQLRGYLQARLAQQKRSSPGEPGKR